MGSTEDLLQSSRNKFVIEIMDIFQRHFSFTGPDVTNELKKIALELEEKIYAAAVDKQDYLHQMSLKMLSLRSHVSRDGNSLASGFFSSNQKPPDPGLLMSPQMRNISHLPAIVSGNDISLPVQIQPQEASLPQNQKLVLGQLQHQADQLQQQARLNSIPQELQQILDNPGGLLQHWQQQSSVEQHMQLLKAQSQRLPDVPTTAVELSGQTGQSNVIDSQEKIYQKLQKLKDTYFPDLRELLQRLTMKCQQPLAADQLEKLKLYRTKIHRMMQYLQVSKGNIPPGFPEDKIDAVEKQIQSVLNSFKPGKPALQREQGHEFFPPQPCSHSHFMQQYSQSLIPASVESSGQTGQLNVIDSQEKVYQKHSSQSIRIRSSLSSNNVDRDGDAFFVQLQKLKDIYFPDLRELLQRLTMKCQQPRAPDQLEKIKLYRTKVHRMMQYFQVSRHNIPPGFPEDKIDAVENQIQSVLNSFKPGKFPLQQQ